MKKTSKYVLIGIFSILFISCNQDDLNKITDIAVDASKKNILVSEQIQLTAVADNGTDVTNETTFYVDGQEISGTAYSFSSAGIKHIKGIYKETESNDVEVNVNIPTGYSQKVLVEDYTGVWCGYCPRVAYSIQQIEANDEFGDKMVPVAIHLYDYNDPFTCADGLALKDAFNISGLPQGRINKTVIWTAPQPDHLDDVYNLIGGDAPLGIAINSSLNSGNVEASIIVGFAQDYTNLGIVVFLLEDGLIHNQTNYTELFGGEYTLVDFVHNDVLRKAYTNILGDAIPDNQSVTDNAYEFSINAPLPDTIENSDNLKLVAFVVDKSTNTALNVQEVLLGGNQPFD